MHLEAVCWFSGPLIYPGAHRFREKAFSVYVEGRNHQEWLWWQYLFRRPSNQNYEFSRYCLWFIGTIQALFDGRQEEGLKFYLISMLRGSAYRAFIFGLRNFLAPIYELHDVRPYGEHGIIVHWTFNLQFWVSQFLPSWLIVLYNNRYLLFRMQ